MNRSKVKHPRTMTLIVDLKFHLLMYISAFHLVFHGMRMYDVGDCCVGACGRVRMGVFVRLCFSSLVGWFGWLVCLVGLLACLLPCLFVCLLACLFVCMIDFACMCVCARAPATARYSQVINASASS